MSGLNKAEIRIGTLDQTTTIGAALFGEPTAALPTLSDMDVTEGYIGLGYLVEDGLMVALGQAGSAASGASRMPPFPRWPRSRSTPPA